MQSRKSAFSVVLVAATLLALTSFASAGAYTAVISYGDSLSDNGNLSAVSAYPPSPYYNGRFSNGPVTVEYLSTSLHSPLYDFAWGGATTGKGNYIDGGSQTSFGIHGFPGMLTEVAGTLPSVTPTAASSLFVVWGGPNDFLTNGFTAATANTAVANLLTIIADLQGAGAKHILVPGMPDLGLTPDYYGNLGAKQLSMYFNSLLLSELPKGVTYYDTFDFMHAVAADPLAYGFTNVTTPCFDGTTVCSDPNSYLFWDGFHPTTAADVILAGQFEQAVVPEPSSLLMLGTGVVGLAGVLKWKMSA